MKTTSRLHRGSVDSRPALPLSRNMTFLGASGRQCAGGPSPREEAGPPDHLRLARENPYRAARQLAGTTAVQTNSPPIDSPAVTGPHPSPSKPNRWARAYVHSKRGAKRRHVSASCFPAKFRHLPYSGRKTSFGFPAAAGTTPPGLRHPHGQTTSTDPPPSPGARSNRRRSRRQPLGRYRPGMTATPGAAMTARWSSVPDRAGRPLGQERLHSDRGPG